MSNIRIFRVLTAPTTPEPLDIETALERDLRRSIVAANAKKASDAARAKDAARWLAEVERNIVDETKNLARAEKAGGDFKNVAALFEVLHAHARLLLAHQEYVRITKGGK